MPEKTESIGIENDGIVTMGGVLQCDNIIPSVGLEECEEKTSIVEKQVLAIQVDRQCESCDGIMQGCEGVVLMSCPPQYPHKCFKCGQVSHYTKQYPYIKYEHTNA